MFVSQSMALVNGDIDGESLSLVPLVTAARGTVSRYPGSEAHCFRIIAVIKRLSICRWLLKSREQFYWLHWLPLEFDYLLVAWAYDMHLGG